MSIVYVVVLIYSFKQNRPPLFYNQTWSKYYMSIECRLLIPSLIISKCSNEI